jgi:tRNA U34 5-carboxymethylaminomethyl modifying enzyme MnmG/GidA
MSEEIYQLRQKQQYIESEIAAIKKAAALKLTIKAGDTVRLAGISYRVFAFKLSDKLEVERFWLDRIKKDGTIGRRKTCYSWDWKQLEKL